jgi:hypothetical protein
VRRKCLENWKQKSWFILHDAATPHRSSVIKKYSAKHNVTAL